MAEDRAAFGIYPSSGRRPERLNQSRNVNAPLQLLRGWTAGLLGLPGDVEGLVRMLPGIQNETPVLPTSDFYREYLPGYDPRPAATALSGLGALTGGAGSTRVAREGLGALKRATDVNAIRNYIRSAQGVSGMPGAAVVKPKGGNWLAGATSPERAVSVLKTHQNPQQELAYIRQELLQPQRGEAYQQLTARLPQAEREAAINTWIDQKLAKYIRNEMATPEDPVRKLAERGVLHFDPEAMPRYMEDVWAMREKTSFPAMQGTSPLAQKWEAYADQMVRAKQLGEPIRSGNPGGLTMKDLVASEPGGEWAMKAPDEQMVYELRRPGTSSAQVVSQELGFDHLIDELRNATRADSDLPRELRLRPEQLSKVTMPQAVELVDRINKWRAAQAAEANLALARNPATFTVKEYPKQKMQWVELRSPEFKAEDALADMTESERSWFQRYLDKGDSPQEAFKAAVGNRLPMPGQKALEDALKYEGEVMGHCVGGYCPAVAEGQSKIYSLRDAKGEPHVTIEVRPVKADENKAYLEFLRTDIGRSEFPAWLKQKIEINPDYQKTNAFTVANQFLAERGAPLLQVVTPPPEIVQIKGKGNRAPKEDYLPMVQDFVKSQRWSRVGDLTNTGLIPVSQVSDLAGRIRAAGKEPPHFITKQEEAELLKQYYPNEGYARGGLVSAYDPDRIAEMAAQLEEEMYA